MPAAEAEAMSPYAGNTLQPRNAAEAAAIAGAAAVDRDGYSFRGSYGGDGAAAQKYNELVQEHNARVVEQQQAQVQGTPQWYRQQQAEREAQARGNRLLTSAELAARSPAYASAQRAEQRGDYIDPYVAAKARQAGFEGKTYLSKQPSRATVPVRVNDDLPGSISARTAAGLKTTTGYTPLGRGQTELDNVKFGYTSGGRVGFYQRTSSGTWLLASSASGGALQSGKFTIGKPESPVVYTQYGAGRVLSKNANREEAAKVLANPERYSRPGAEAYGGYVMPLDNRTISSSKAQLSTYKNPLNLANLVNPQAVNAPKSEQVATGDVPFGNAVHDSTPGAFVMVGGKMQAAMLSPEMASTFTKNDTPVERPAGLIAPSKIALANPSSNLSPNGSIAAGYDFSTIRPISQMSKMSPEGQGTGAGVKKNPNHVTEIIHQEDPEIGITVIPFLPQSRVSFGNKNPASNLLGSFQKPQIIDYDLVSVKQPTGSITDRNPLTGEYGAAHTRTFIDPATNKPLETWSEIVGGSPKLPGMLSTIDTDRAQLDTMENANVRDINGKRMWLGTGEDYNTFTSLSEKYNANVEAYKKESDANPSYEIKHDLTNTITPTNVRASEGLSRWDMGQQYLGEHTLPNPVIINAMGNAAITGTGLKQVSPGADFTAREFLGFGTGMLGEARRRPGDLAVITVQSVAGGMLFKSALGVGTAATSLAVSQGANLATKGGALGLFGRGLLFGGKMASTPLARQGGNVALTGAGLYVVGEAVTDIASKPTAQERGGKFLETGIAFLSFGAGMSGGWEPDISTVGSKYYNPYAGGKGFAFTSARAPDGTRAYKMSYGEGTGENYGTMYGTSPGERSIAFWKTADNNALIRTVKPGKVPEGIYYSDASTFAFKKGTPTPRYDTMGRIGMDSSGGGTGGGVGSRGGSIDIVGEPAPVRHQGTYISRDGYGSFSMIPREGSVITPEGVGSYSMLPARGVARPVAIAQPTAAAPTIATTPMLEMRQPAGLLESGRTPSRRDIKMQMMEDSLTTTGYHGQMNQYAGRIGTPIALDMPRIPKASYAEGTPLASAISASKNTPQETFGLIGIDRATGQQTALSPLFVSPSTKEIAVPWETLLEPVAKYREATPDGMVVALHGHGAENLPHGTEDNRVMPTWVNAEAFGVVGKDKVYFRQSQNLADYIQPIHARTSGNVTRGVKKAYEDKKWTADTDAEYAEKELLLRNQRLAKITGEDFHATLIEDVMPMVNPKYIKGGRAEPRVFKEYDPYKDVRTKMPPDALEILQKETPTKPSSFTSAPTKRGATVRVGKKYQSSPGVKLEEVLQTKSGDYIEVLPTMSKAKRVGNEGYDKFSDRLTKEIIESDWTLEGKRDEHTSWQARRFSRNALDTYDVHPDENALYIHRSGKTNEILGIIGVNERRASVDYLASRAPGSGTILMTLAETRLRSRGFRNYEVQAAGESVHPFYQDKIKMEKDYGNLFRKDIGEGMPNQLYKEVPQKPGVVRLSIDDYNVRLPEKLKAPSASSPLPLREETFEQSIQNYQGLDYLPMNRMARGMEVSAPNSKMMLRAKAQVSTIFAGMDNFGEDIQEGTTLYRGVKGAGANAYHNDTGLQSWTTSPFIAVMFAGEKGVILKQNVPISRKGLQFEDNPEAEVILTPRPLKTIAKQTVVKEDLVPGMSGSESGKRLIDVITVEPRYNFGGNLQKEVPQKPFEPKRFDLTKNIIEDAKVIPGKSYAKIIRPDVGVTVLKDSHIENYWKEPIGEYKPHSVKPVEVYSFPSVGKFAERVRGKTGAQRQYQTFASIEEEGMIEKLRDEVMLTEWQSPGRTWGQARDARDMALYAVESLGHQEGGNILIGRERGGALGGVINWNVWEGEGSINNIGTKKGFGGILERTAMDIMETEGAEFAVLTPLDDEAMAFHEHMGFQNRPDDTMIHYFRNYDAEAYAEKTKSQEYRLNSFRSGLGLPPETVGERWMRENPEVIDLGDYRDDAEILHKETPVKPLQKYITTSDIKTESNWGELQTTHVKERSLLRGVITDRSAIPDTLYHVTTNVGAVEFDGILRHMPGGAGLGKGTSIAHHGVSFTTSLDDARLIKRDITRNVEIARGADFNEKFPTYLAEDERIFGSPIPVKGEVMDEYAFREKRARAEGYKVEDAGIEALRTYRMSRDRVTKGKLEDPIIFGQSDVFSKVDPKNIGIVTARKSAIPEDVVVRDPLGGFMHEVMVHSDVPISSRLEKEIPSRRKGTDGLPKATFKFLKEGAEDSSGIERFAVISGKRTVGSGFGWKGEVPASSIKIKRGDGRELIHTHPIAYDSPGSISAIIHHPSSADLGTMVLWGGKQYRIFSPRGITKIELPESLQLSERSSISDFKTSQLLAGGIRNYVDIETGNSLYRAGYRGTWGDVPPDELLAHRDRTATKLYDTFGIKQTFTPYNELQKEVPKKPIKVHAFETYSVGESLPSSIQKLPSEPVMRGLEESRKGNPVRQLWNLQDDNGLYRNSKITVATTKGGKALGTIITRTEPSGYTVSGNPTVWIQGMETYLKGRGIGKELIKNVERTSLNRSGGEPVDIIVTTPSHDLTKYFYKNLPGYKSSGSSINITTKTLTMDNVLQREIPGRRIRDAAGKDIRKNADYPDTIYTPRQTKTTKEKTEIVEIQPKYKPLPPAWSAEYWNPTELYDASPEVFGGSGMGRDGGSAAVSRGGYKSIAKPTAAIKSTQKITTYYESTKEDIASSRTADSAISKVRADHIVGAHASAQNRAKALAASEARAKARMEADMSGRSTSKTEPSAEATAAESTPAHKPRFKTYNRMWYDGSELSGWETAVGSAATISASRGNSRPLPSTITMPAELSRSGMSGVASMGGARSMTMFREKSGTLSNYKSNINIMMVSRPRGLAVPSGKSKSLANPMSGGRAITMPDSNARGLAVPTPDARNVARSDPLSRPIPSALTTPTPYADVVPYTRPVEFPIERKFPQRERYIDPVRPVEPGIPVIIPPVGFFGGGGSTGGGGGGRGGRGYPWREVILIRSEFEDFGIGTGGRKRRKR